MYWTKFISYILGYTLVSFMSFLGMLWVYENIGFKALGVVFFAATGFELIKSMGFYQE